MLIGSCEKVYLPSPRNSVPAHVTLFTSLQCTKLVVAEPQAPCVPSILKKLKLDTLSLPSLEDLLNIGDVDDIPFPKSFVEAKNDAIFVLHTSGSTGESVRIYLGLHTKSCRYAEASDIHSRLGVEVHWLYLSSNAERSCGLWPLHHDWRLLHNPTAISRKSKYRKLCGGEFSDLL